MGVGRNIWTPAGDFRHVVQVEQKTPSRGTMGEPVEVWNNFATIFCKIWPGKGREAEEARRETGKVQTRFFTRYRSGINQGMRLVFKGRTYDIVGVANIGELNREIEIAAVETI